MIYAVSVVLHVCSGCMSRAELMRSVARGRRTTKPPASPAALSDVADPVRIPGSAVHLEGGDERLLRDLDLAELAHALLALLLLVEELALAGDVAAVALGGDILRQGRMVSRAMILPPIAAWTGIWNRWRGIRSFSFSHIARPRLSARVRWTSMESASTGSAFTRIDIFTRSPSR